MSERNDGGPAYPHTQPPHNVTEDECGTHHGGMSLRDYFAAKAIDAAFKFYDEGYCGRAEMDGLAVEMVGAIAYEIADAMLKERAK